MAIMQQFNGRDKQAGASLFGWIIILFVLGFFALLAVRLTPYYVEYYGAKKTLATLDEIPHLNKKTPMEITELLLGRYRFNDIDRITADNITVVKEEGVVEVKVVYEVRTPIMGNVDAVISFDDNTKVVAQ